MRKTIATKPPAKKPATIAAENDPYSVPLDEVAAPVAGKLTPAAAVRVRAKARKILGR